METLFGKGGGFCFGFGFFDFLYDYVSSGKK